MVSLKINTKKKEEEKPQQTTSSNIPDPFKIRDPILESKQNPPMSMKPEPTKTPTQPEVFRSSETGRASGITLPDGRTFLGLSPDEVNRIATAEMEKKAVPAGAIDVSEARKQEAKAAMGAQLAGQVGQLNPDISGNVQTAGVDYSQALQAGAGRVIPYAGGAAVGGAGVGAVAGGIGAVPGAIIGAAGGAVTGFLSGVLSNLKEQKAGQVSAATIELREYEQNLRAIVTDTNRNPANAATNLDLFNTQLSLIEQSYGKLKLETKTTILTQNDGTPELARYQAFYQRGGAREYLTREMQVALLNPDMNKNLITYEDVTQE